MNRICTGKVIDSFKRLDWAKMDCERMNEGCGCINHYPSDSVFTVNKGRGVIKVTGAHAFVRSTDTTEGIRSNNLIFTYQSNKRFICSKHSAVLIIFSPI